MEQLVIPRLNPSGLRGLVAVAAAAPQRQPRAADLLHVETQMSPGKFSHLPRSQQQDSNPDTHPTPESVV